MRTTFFAVFAFVSLGGFAAPTVSYRVATNIAEHVTSRDAFVRETDEWGLKTALTVGTRREGSAVGRGSAAVGTLAEASGRNALAQGHGTVASGEHTVAMGHAANATNIDEFAWNGNSETDYTGHGRGTFNLNPMGGAKGVWIGERTLDELIDQKGGIATDFLTKTNAADFADVAPSSIVGRVTNEDVRISVTNETLTIWDGTNRVWSSESSGNAVALLTKTNADDFASVAPSSVVWRVTNDQVVIAVEDGELLLIDGETIVWRSSEIDVEGLKAELQRYIDGKIAAILPRLAEVERTVSQKADRDWGKYTSSGRDAPAATVVIDAPTTVFAGGLETETLAFGASSVTYLKNAGVVADADGSLGRFRFIDRLTGKYFGFDDEHETLIGAHCYAITNDHNLISLVYRLEVAGDTYPIIEYTPTLERGFSWERLNGLDGSTVPGASHYVSWDLDTEPGVKIAYINCEGEPSGFFRAVMSDGHPAVATFGTDMPIRPRGGIVATNATLGIEQTVFPVIRGTNVTWEVAE